MVFATPFTFLSIFVNSFPIKTEKIIYFSIFSPKHVIIFQILLLPFYDKMITVVRFIVKNYRNFLGTLYSKLHTLCTLPLYFPV